LTRPFIIKICRNIVERQIATEARTMSMERMTPTKPFSSLDVAWEEWSEAPRFALRYRHLSRAAMGDDYRIGVAIEELAPGKQSSPAHYHIFEEEHVISWTACSPCVSVPTGMT
jgi:hypothetical protein